MAPITIVRRPCGGLPSAAPRRAVPRPQQRIRHMTPRPSLLEDANNFASSMYYVSKGVILFTMFYCSMNYFYYRRQREEMEKQDKEKRDKK